MIARFIITEEQARTGTHTGTCGVCGQHTERGHAHTDILQKTTSNITVTFPHILVQSYVLILFLCGNF